MRYVSLFSGIEAASVAWEPLGWSPLAFCEIDAFPSAVLKYHYPHVINCGDITKVDWRGFAKRTDLVVGGSPCQSFSIAGSRTGLEGASGLMWEYVRAVRQIRPRWLLWENVPGALTSSGGEDFRCLLTSLDALGYSMAWRVLDAQFFGVAQRRERVFLVGYLGDARYPAEVLFESSGLSRDIESSRAARARITASLRADNQSAAYTIRQQEGKPDVICAAGAAANTAIDEDMCGTLTAHMAKHDAPYIAFAQNTRDEVRIQGDGTLSGTLAANEGMKQRTYIASETVLRRLMPIECERLQGFPDNWTRIPYNGKPAEECPDAPRYKAIGNSMAVPVMRWLGKRIEVVDKCSK